MVSEEGGFNRRKVCCSLELTANYGIEVRVREREGDDAGIGMEVLP